MSLLPVRPIPPDDLDLIEAWLRARNGRTPEGVEATLYQNGENKAPLKDWSHVTILKARTKLRAFAERQTVPLVRLGLLESGAFTPESLRAPIIAFARDFELRSRGHIERLLERMGPEANRLKGPLVWRTKSWWFSVTFGKEFYAWLERRGLRPAGSNPWNGVARPQPATISRTMIVETWFTTMLQREWTPKVNAVLALLANGLRSEEVAQLKMTDLYLSIAPWGIIRVLGKGSKLRDVPIYRRTHDALRRYLDARRADLRPYLFPKRCDRGKARTYDFVRPHMCERNIRSMVARVASLSFPGSPDVIARISPHKFRHFFISDWLRRGGNPAFLKVIVGHTSYQTLERYTHADPEWLTTEVLRMDPDATEERHDRRRRPARVPARMGAAVLPIDRATRALFD